MQKLNVFAEARRVPVVLPPGAPFPCAHHRSGLHEVKCDPSNPEHQKYIAELLRVLIKRDRDLQIKCFANLKQLGVWEAIKEFGKARPKTAFAPDFVDLWYLYAHIRAAKPREVLELGSGLSTVAMAVALTQNGSGRLYSVESNKAWAGSTWQSIPESLRNCCDVSFSPSRESQWSGRDSMCFADLPTTSPDMIYIDGAPDGALWLGAETVGQIEDSLGIGTSIFIDSRLSALLFFLKGHAKRKYFVDAQAIVLINETDNQLVDTNFGMDQFENSYLRLLK